MDHKNLHLLRGYRWYTRKDRNTRYCVCKAKSPSTFSGYTSLHLHRLVLPGHRIVDHVNGNGLDNRERNLRPATHAQNRVNSRQTKRRYRGTVDNGLGRWRCQIKHQQVNIYCGTFETEEEAARAYDRMAIELHGEEFAYQNFPTGSGGTDPGPKGAGS